MSHFVIIFIMKFTETSYKELIPIYFIKNLIKISTQKRLIGITK